MTVLRSGTSMGVPTLSCHCRVCSSSDPRDNRTRSSVLLSRDGQNVVIDTCSRFSLPRTSARQARRAGRRGLHSRARRSSFHGLRRHSPLQFSAKSGGANLCFAGNAGSLAAYVRLRLRQRAHQEHGSAGGYPHHPATLRVAGREVDAGAARPCTATGAIFGYRVGGLAYLTDFSSLPAESKPLVTDVDDLVLDAFCATRRILHADRIASAGIGDRAAAAPCLVHAHRARFDAPGDQRATGARRLSPLQLASRRIQVSMCRRVRISHASEVQA